MIAVRVPKDIEDRLDNLAQLTGRTKTWYVRDAGHRSKIYKEK